MSVNELIAALSALPTEQRALPVVAHTGSWDQGSGPVTSMYLEDEPRDNEPEHVVLCATDWRLCQPTIVEADQ